MTTPTPTLPLVALLPLAVGLVLPAVALGLWLPALLFGGLLVVGRLWGWQPAMGQLQQGAALLVGGLVGAAAGAAVALPEGPVPPELMGPAVGALSALMVACALAGQRRSWNYGALTVAIALSSQPVTDITAAGGISALVLVATIFARSGARLWTGARLAGFALFLAAGLGVAALGTRAMFSAQGVLTPFLEALVDLDAVAGGLGIQSTVRLSPFSSVAPSRARVMELDGPPPRYLRGQVMDRFDGEVWSASATVAAPQQPSPTLPAGDTTLRVLLHKGMRATIPAPAGTTALDGLPPTYTSGWLVSGAPWRGSTVSLLRGPEQLPAEAQSPVPADRALPADLAAALQPLSAPVLGGFDGTEDKARALEQHFQSEYTYALQTNLRGDDHPLVVLIKEKRPAYCAYYASAMAAMLRAEGEATRLVGGFVPVETNPVTGRTLVRSRDAHAWVEVWLPEEKRWATFDPTPSREAVLDLEQPDLLDALVSGARDALMRAFLRLRTDPVGLVRDLLLSWPALLLIGLGGGWSLWLRWQQRTFGTRRRVRPGAGSTDPALWPHYRAYLRLLERHARLRAGPAESDAELLARLREQDPGAADAAARFLAAYRRARYRREPGAEAGLAAALAALKAALRSR